MDYLDDFICECQSDELEPYPFLWEENEEDTIYDR